MSKMGIVGAICCQHAVETHYEWTVEDFFTLSETEGDWYDSPDFQFSGRTFNLWFCPNIQHGSILLYMGLRVPSPPMKIRFVLGIKTAEGDTEVLGSDTRVFSTSHDFGYKSMKRSELLKRREQLAPCGDVTFTANLKIDVSRSDIETTEVAVQTTVEDTAGQEANEGRQALENPGTREVAVQTSIEDEGGQEANGGRQALENPDFVTLGQSLRELYVAGKDCDVTFEVEDKKFRAHKLILGARTPVLAAMFSHNTTEAETGIVRVEDCHPEAFEAFLRFVYSDAAENLTGQNVTNVYYAADKYNLPGLKKECVRHMLSNFTASTVCNVIALAERHGEELLQEKATQFFVDNAREVFLTASWRRFMVENSNLANDLIIRGYENLK